MSEREKFGRFGALMVMAGSAVGLGNIWRFPYLLGENGGAVFLLVYIVFAIIIALPIFFCEFIIGRRGASNCCASFGNLVHDGKWKGVGFFGIITAFIIMSYYSVIGGWSVEYLFKSCTFEFSSTDSPQKLSHVFNNFVSSTWAPLLGHLLFLGCACIIVSKGVKGGIEKFGKLAMPALFFIVMGIAVYVAFLPESSQGYKYLFHPDFSKFSPKMCLSALGQGFYSLSLGCCAIVTYASYIRRSDDMFKHCSETAAIDLLFAVIAGCAIMPAVFAFGVNPGSGPSLVYETLPFIFSKMPGGNVVAICFFAGLLVAAITSEISMIEIVVTYLVEERKKSRKKSVLLIFCIAFFLGVICSLSFGPLSGLTLMSKNIFGLFDTFASNYLMPIGALLISFFVGWKMPRDDVYDEFTNGGSVIRNVHIFKVIYPLIRYVVPAGIIAIMVSNFVF